LGAYAKTYAVVDIAFDAKGTAWVSTNEYLGVFDADAKQVKIVWKNAAPPDKEVVTSFFKPTADGTVWAGQFDKLLRFREGKADVFPLPHRSPYPYVDMAFDAAGDMYVSNRKYIFKFKQPDKASPGSADIETIYRFPEKGIMGTTKLLIDRSGLLWAGTNGYGLLKHNPGNPHFRHYLAGKSPRRIHVDKQNRVWVWNSGSKFGLLDKKNNVAQVPLLTDPQYHQHDCASTPDGALWVLCESILAEPKKNGALIKLDGHSLKVLAKYPMPIDVGLFGRLFSDKKGNLWVLGAKSTLLRFDPNTVQTEVHDFSAATGFSELALSFHIGQDGHYWIGTPHGLLRATLTGGGLSCERFVNKPNDPNSLSCNYILCAIDDPQAPERYCWVGTKGGGISRLDKITGQFKNFTTAEGLPNNVVYGILPETSLSGAPTLFWLSTNRGLSRFDPNTGLCQNYFSTDGLQDNEFNTISFAKAADGQLYFGGVNGITAFYPSQVKSANKAAEVQLTNLLVNNKPLLPLGIALHDRILQLQHLQNQLTFNFAAIDFAAPQMNQYRYRLMDVDRDWVESTTKNSATYAHLNPGKYVFEVITGGSRGVWNHNAARLTVQILPPWWQTGWACAIYSVLAALGAWSFYRFQMNRARLKNKLKYEQREAARLIEIDKLKTDFFSSITHELRTPITLLLEPARQLLHETSAKMPDSGSN
jgi:Predicted periplasmic ligand-binding sensor domain